MYDQHTEYTEKSTRYGKEITVRATQAQDAELLCALQDAAYTPQYERYHDAGNPCLCGVEDIAKRLERPYLRCVRRTSACCLSV